MMSTASFLVVLLAKVIQPSAICSIFRGGFGNMDKRSKVCPPPGKNAFKTILPLARQSVQKITERHLFFWVVQILLHFVRGSSAKKAGGEKEKANFWCVYVLYGGDRVCYKVSTWS